jgi:uncharacterized protein DUF4272
MLPTALLCASLLAAGAGASPAGVDQRKDQIQDIEKAATPAALARKRRSDELLRAEGVPVNEHLPAIEDETQVRRRERDEIAYRALALIVVSMRGGGLDETEVRQVVADFRLAKHFTPAERAFMKNPQPSEQDRQQFSWRIEAAWVLLWSLGYVDELGKPTAECDVAAAVRTLGERDEKQFLAEAKLRPLAEIVEQADRIYRYHWAVVDESIGGKPAGDLNVDVVMERHHALNWLIGYLGQEWDDVSTDT